MVLRTVVDIRDLSSGSNDLFGTVAPMAERKDRDSSIWVLVPLAALMIPIIAVADGNALVLVGVGAAFLVIVLGVVARSLMDYRHELRLKEIEAERRLIQEDRLRFDDAKRVLDRDSELRELRSAIDQPAERSGTDPETDVAEA